MLQHNKKLIIPICRTKAIVSKVFFYGDLLSISCSQYFKDMSTKMCITSTKDSFSYILKCGLIIFNFIA